MPHTINKQRTRGERAVRRKHDALPRPRAPAEVRRRQVCQAVHGDVGRAEVAQIPRRVVAQVGGDGHPDVAAHAAAVALQDEARERPPLANACTRVCIFALCRVKGAECQTC